jgi:hypothetical protein
MPVVENLQLPWRRVYRRLSTPFDFFMTGCFLGHALGKLASSLGARRLNGVLMRETRLNALLSIMAPNVAVLCRHGILVVVG